MTPIDLLFRTAMMANKLAMRLGNGVPTKMCLGAWIEHGHAAHVSKRAKTTKWWGVRLWYQIKLSDTNTQLEKAQWRRAKPHK
jgi:hypothetical protein